MTISALFAVSACTVTPLALNAVAEAAPPAVNGSGVEPAGAVAWAPGLTVPANAPGGASEDPVAVAGPPSLPVKSARSVCATLAASALRR